MKSVIARLAGKGGVLMPPDADGTTPRPWRVDEERVSREMVRTYIVTDGPHGPVEVGVYIPGNARLIVRAVNAHDDLMMALTTISGWSKCQCVVKHGDNPNCCVLVAEQALAKAKGVQ